MILVGRNDRGVAPIIGNILLVAVVVVIAVSLTTLSFAFLDGAGSPTADAAFEYEPTPAGLEMTPTALGTDVVVRLNGRAVATFDPDSAGETALLPTAPGDTITVVSRDEDRSVLVNRQVDDRSEVGDFIAYYTFDQRDDAALVDRSGNGNDGTITGATRGQDGTGSYLSFDGDDDATVSDIDAPEGLDTDVDAFTIAVSYRPARSSGQRELVEHIDSGKNWFITNRWAQKPASAGPDEYKAQFKTGPGGGCSNCISGGVYRAGERRVVVGTYDGTESTVYVDGSRRATGTTALQEVSMGTMTIGQDAEFDGQHFQGKIYEIRLYYRAFEGQKVQAITNAMP
jgi:flagellin-like protein